MGYILNGTFPFIHKIEERGSFQVGTNDGGMPLTFDFWSDYSVPSHTFAGVTVDKDAALKQSAYWRAVNLISSQIASFPVGLFRRLPDGDTQEITDHPSVRILKIRPNKIMTPLVWRESMQACTLAHGNGYSFIERKGDGTPTALKILDPADVEPVTKGGSLIYKYGEEAIDPFFMLHIPGLSFNGVKGKAILDVAAESMGVGLAMQKYSANMFKNGAKQTGVLMHPNRLSDTARQGLRRSYDKVMKDNEGGTLILDEGMKFIPTVFSPDQAQLLSSKQFSIQDLARWFGVPPHLLFEESRSTFNNISEQGIEFVRYTLTQWVTRWEAELGSKLLSEEELKDHFFKLNMNALLRGDMKSRYEAYHYGITDGWLDKNEVRAWEDLNRMPENTMSDEE